MQRSRPGFLIYILPRKLYDHLDVAMAMLDRLTPSFHRNPTRDQSIEPVVVGASQSGSRQLVMAAIGIHGSEYDVVLENKRAPKVADIKACEFACSSDASEIRIPPARSLQADRR